MNKRETIPTLLHTAMQVYPDLSVAEIVAQSCINRDGFPSAQWFDYSDDDVYEGLREFIRKSGKTVG